MKLELKVNRQRYFKSWSKVVDKFKDLFGYPINNPSIIPSWRLWQWKGENMVHYDSRLKALFGKLKCGYLEP